MDVALGYFEDDDVAEDDLTKPPSSGIAYLKRVQMEAEQCPDIVMATYPKSTQKTDTQTSDTPVSNLSVAPSLLNAPKEELQLRIAADFASLRQTLIHYKTQNIPTKVKFPPMTNVHLWCLFCFGKTFYQKCYNNTKIDLDSTEYELPHAPLLSILQNINQPMAVTLLCIHLKILEQNGFSVEQGQWLFGLLLCLDKPVPSDTISLLRDLSRQCAKCRAALAPEEKNNMESHLNLIIILVAKYYGQMDLSLKGLPTLT